MIIKGRLYFHCRLLSGWPAGESEQIYVRFGGEPKSSELGPSRACDPRLFVWLASVQTYTQMACTFTARFSEEQKNRNALTNRANNEDALVASAPTQLAQHAAASAAPAKHRCAWPAAQQETQCRPSKRPTLVWRPREPKADKNHRTSS